MKLGMPSASTAGPRLLRLPLLLSRPRPRPPRRLSGCSRSCLGASTFGCSPTTGATTTGAATSILTGAAVCSATGRTFSASGFLLRPPRVRFTTSFSETTAAGAVSAVLLPDIACSIRGTSILTRRSISAKFFSSRGVQIIMAVPSLPARPVRPIRCT